MSKVVVKNLLGEKVDELELNADVFGLEVNNQLLYQVVEAQRSNKRKVIAHTKTRAERTGSTIKPWKQKGTGRARTGSVKNPIWRKGGVTFGPRKDKNYKQKINKKMKVKALKMALSSKVNDQELIVVDNFKFSEEKTKQVALALKKLKLNRKTLLALEPGNKKVARWAKNIQQITAREVEKLNVLDILNHRFLWIDKKGIEFLEKKYKSEK